MGGTREGGKRKGTNRGQKKSKQKIIRREATAGRREGRGTRAMKTRGRGTTGQERRVQGRGAGDETAGKRGR